MGRGYGQFCPVAKAAEIFCERWNALLFRELGAGSARFCEIQRGVPLMSPSMLSRRLKELEREGVVSHHKDDDGISRYGLTAAGEEFLPLVHALGTWGQRWTRRELEAGEIDFRLLLWDMERRVRADALGAEPTTVQLVFTDLPEDRSTWWFVNDGTVELCLKDPGFEIDLYLSVTVADMIRIWRGDIGVARALADERLRAHGPRHLRRRIEPWLNLSPLAAVPSQRTAAASPAARRSSARSSRAH